MEVIAKLVHVSKVYGEGETRVLALDDACLEIDKGEFVTIVGPSGSGKSTFLNILGGLERPTDGHVEIDGIDIYDRNDDEISKFRRERIGFIFQDFNLIPILNVYENIVFPLQIDGKKTEESHVMEIISDLEMESKIRMFPNQLSGGQQQRVAIARALVTNPSLILADEPTGSLDSESTKQVMELLMSSAKKYHQTIVMITHNEMITKDCDRILKMSDGRLSGGVF